MEGLDVIRYSFIKIIYNKCTLKKQKYHTCPKNNINQLVLFNSSLTAHIRMQPLPPMDVQHTERIPISQAKPKYTITN
jgi:hypothetical protein